MEEELVYCFQNNGVNYSLKNDEVILLAKLEQYNNSNIELCVVLKDGQIIKGRIRMIGEKIQFLYPFDAEIPFSFTLLNDEGRKEIYCFEIKSFEVNE